MGRTNEIPKWAVPVLVIAFVLSVLCSVVLALIWIAGEATETTMWGLVGGGVTALVSGVTLVRLPWKRRVTSPALKSARRRWWLFFVLVLLGALGFAMSIVGLVGWQHDAAGAVCLPGGILSFIFAVFMGDKLDSAAKAVTAAYKEARARAELVASGQPPVRLVPSDD